MNDKIIDIKDNINKMYENLFTSKEHPFFNDLHTVNKLAKKTIQYQKKFTTHTTIYQQDKDNIKRIINKEEEEKDVEYKILKKNDIYRLGEEMSNVMNWKKLHHIILKISQYLLQSNVKDENILYDIISKDTKSVNIMIIGSGPIGLFLGCYLKLYYNYTSMNSSPRVNVVIYDSRIEKPGFRKPYNRQRPFATSSSYLNLIIPKIYCWNNTIKQLFVNIFILEYFLYTTAITKYNIPMIYNDYNWDDYVKIIEKGKFKVVFNCTGGRLQNNIIKNIDTKWFNKLYGNNLLDNKLNKKLNIDTHNNLVTLEDTSNKFIKNHYYASISVHRNDTFYTFLIKYDIDITNKNDLVFLNKFKNKKINYNDIIIVIEGIKNSTDRNFLYSMFTEKKNIYKDNIFIVDVWSIYIRHAIKIADVIKVGKENVLYIGAGDTIFHSHFIVGAGLNRILDFTVKCANKLTDL